MLRPVCILSHMDWKSLIARRPEVLSGKPTFVGTRISVVQVLEHLGDGWPAAEVLGQFPQLTANHLRAAMAYAARIAAS